MPALLRTTLALLAGVVVTFFTISAVEQLGHILYRAPAGLDWQDSSAVSAYLKQLPVGALLLVLVGWLLGIFTGLTAATMLAGGRCRGRFALAIGCLVFLGAVSNFYLLPHPAVVNGAKFNPNSIGGCALLVGAKKTVLANQ
ncbi:MAG: hypothetical protein U5L02_10540 [Rheinheimera sp.]|nr:hypothetical protein [Rheinheimera sp.]